MKICGRILLLILGFAALTNCGGSSSTSKQHVPSGLKFRAFVSNPLNASAGGVSPALDIVDASQDLLSTFTVSLAGSVTNAGAMALSPDKTLTLVVNPTSGQLAVVNNAQETVQSTASLPAPAPSIFVWIDNATAFAAVPTAPVPGAQNPQPGAVLVLNLAGSSVSVTATIPVAGVQTVIDSHDGNQLLALGSNSQAVTVISPSQIGTSSDPRTVVSSTSFDHPVWGIFSADDTTAYILNCGAECGGTTASVAVVDMTQSPPQVIASIPVPAATYGLLSGATLYVAGTSSGSGILSVISISSNTVINPAPIVISNGYHNRMELTADGQIFIGARTCSAGCLSIFNTATSAVVIPPATGDVTGIQPIAGRTVVYVCQNGGLNIYDTTTDALQTTQVSIVGQAVDVKLVDTP